MITSEPTVSSLFFNPNPADNMGRSAKRPKTEKSLSSLENTSKKTGQKQKYSSYLNNVLG